ncbi:MAG: LamB/YcsF family protein [Gemmatimonadaceae bacterium]
MNPRRTIDLNADLGEYTGLTGASRDAAILDVVTSANIACGGHAGDREVMQRTVDAAFSRGVAIGAHPSYPDREGFGRREMEISTAALSDEIVSQVEAMRECCSSAGARLQYVKPHGALYNVATREESVARVIAEAVRRVDAALVLLGLFGSPMIVAGERAALIVATEGFPDRGYLSNGTLVPRSREDAVLHDAKTVSTRAIRMARDGYVESTDGTRVAVSPDSLCIHGDNPEALDLVRATREALEASGIIIASFAK